MQTLDLVGPRVRPEVEDADANANWSKDYT